MTRLPSLARFGFTGLLDLFVQVSGAVGVQHTATGDVAGQKYWIYSNIAEVNAGRP
jgi:hypothetical protein